MGKRLFDLFGALLLLVFTIPLFAFIAVWIKTSSRGPIIFRQLRAGRHGIPFVIFKFRTLQDKSARPLDKVLQGDERVTAPGRFLRKTHIDELPQLINVLRGQMSLVGPRPEPFDWVWRNLEKIPRYGYRFKVLPGLTGLAQLHRRDEMAKHGASSKLRLDLLYIKRQNICLDLKILCRTARAVVQCRGL